MNGFTVALGVLGILVLTAGTALFVAAEFSLTALERTTVDAAARDGGKRDALMQRAHRSLSFQLSGAQLGISITTLATGYLAEPLIARLLTPLLDATGLPSGVSAGVALALALFLATSVSMIYGELVPKNLAVAHPLAVARAAAGPQLLFSTLFTPVIKATNGTANAVLRRMGIEPAEELRSARSAQELLSVVRNSAKQGAMDASTAALVDRSLQFGTRTADELMTPRSKIEVLQAEDTVADLVRKAAETGYSRFPIVRGDLDDTVGIVHVKQVFEVPRGERATITLDRLAKTVATVPSTLDGDAVMAQVRGNGLQTALVADEYGGTAGMVTVEDLIEEIVGDVRDEHDELTPDVVADDGRWRVSGLLRIDEVAAATGYRAPEGAYDTIGGLVMTTLGRIPAAGDVVELTSHDSDEVLAGRPARWSARVVAMDGRRIDSLDLVDRRAVASAVGDRPDDERTR